MGVRTVEKQPMTGPFVAQDLGFRELLALHRIRKSWDDHLILDDVELVLDAGTLTWIGGVNGIGKTTLLRICAGLIMPESGIVDLDGLHPRRDRAEFQRRMGFLSAGDRGLYARLTVRQHLDIWGRLALLGRKKLKPAIDRMIERLDLTELKDRRMDRLSMGQRQRVRMAMAFLHEPDLILLDEPLNSLDENGADLLRNLLAELTERGGAGLWCSPSVAGQADFDRELRLEQGQLREAKPQ